jgi:hypothetical protein
MQVISNFQLHNAQPITPPWEMEMYWILWCISISDFQIIVSHILDSDYIQIIFHIKDHVRTKNVSAPLEEFTDWEQLQSLVSNLISPRIEINSGAEVYKAARAFTASIVSAYMLSTSKIALSELTKDLPGLDLLLKFKKRMWKLWQEIRDPGCKKAVHFISKSIRRMTRKKALER